LILSNRTVAEFLERWPLLKVNCDLPLTKPTSEEGADNNKYDFQI
jgi:hypothetical protein